MQNEQQYQQLLMQYEQLKNGAQDIASLIEKEDYDSAITMIKLREPIFLSCKCIRRYLDLTQEQQVVVDKVFNELKSLEEKNMETLKKIMDEVQMELSKTQKLQKIQRTYNSSENSAGSVVNIEE